MQCEAALQQPINASGPIAAVNLGCANAATSLNAKLAYGS
jgi:hypothetical protein